MLTIRNLEDALLAPDPAAALHRLTPEIRPEPGLGAIVGFGDGKHHKALWPHTCTVVSQTPPKLHLRYAALFHDAGKVERFRMVDGKVSFHGHEQVSGRIWRRWAALRKPHVDADHVYDIVVGLGLLEAFGDDWTDSAVRRLDRELAGRFEDVLAVSRADITTSRPERRRAILERMDRLLARVVELRRVDAIPPALPTGLGTELEREFGLRGRDLGTVMNRLKSLVEAGRLCRQAPFGVLIEEVRSWNLPK